MAAHTDSLVPSEGKYTDPLPQPRPLNGPKQLLAASVGNAVEWFDWYIYSILAIYFSTQFFPAEAESSLVPLLGTMAVFAVGFFARPLGGLLIGYLADRFGRKRILVLTVLGMGIGSLMIAFAPTYAQIGVFAPIILVVARLVQGLSAGGEYAASSAFLVESAPAGRRGFYSSFFYISATAANLLAIGIAALLTNLLTAEDMVSWGWRVPFIIGAVAALIALWVRSHAEETLREDQVAASAHTCGNTERVRVFSFLKHHPKSVFFVFGMTASSAIVFYIWTGFLPTYANIAVGFDVKQGLTASLISLTWFLLLQPVMGALSDRFGRKPLLIAFGVFFTVATVPLLGALDDSFASFLAVQLLGVTFIAAATSIVQAVFSELFPRKLRSAGIGFPYAVSVALFGGTAPYVATWMASQGNISGFAWYISGISLVSLIIMCFVPETFKKELN
ncbi:MFS transporter [Leucobacter aridicollis]|uniref:MFS transporter n=1 Tax=Leucobacter aridicollis TaxID=283878 RepID=UPI0021072CAD|nr:MFS transporter [Leucobacter aridicollis]